MTVPTAHALSAERPYPGLRSFARDDHEFFFGREDQVFALYRLIDGSRFAAVVGSSGSGKSSLVRAGLLPLLDQETRERVGRTWLCREMRPGNAPLAELTDLLASLTTDGDPAIAAARRERIAFDLSQSSFGIGEVVGRIENLSDTSLLLVVDQFEELFRYAASTTRGSEDARSRDEAKQFVQLLLEASRSQTKVHVLVTMRSDFIGDCARFHGLAEAVSATQFLVPPLTGDQLEEVIRKPIEKADRLMREQPGAGASIDAALVERLLNDCRDDLDQLPVSQHCLLRLWERAAADLSARADKGSLRQGTANAGVPSAHHLNLDRYKEVGRLDGALSQHADEIMSKLHGRKLAVEQVFRALAEVDKEGRAIRRAIPLKQLIAEVAGDDSAPGVPEEHVRDVLDRFRADDCSFLMPPLSAEPVLDPEKPIDVGHEALLRRWEAVSGKADPAQSNERSKGWLKAEEHDGQQYRVLLASLGGAGKGRLPGDQVDGWLEWWNARPRTPAWASRYGGKYDRVKRLLQESWAHKQRVVWRKRGLAAAAAALPLMLAGGFVALKFYQQSEHFAQQKAIAEANFNLAIYSAQNLSDRVLAILQRGGLGVQAARDLLATAEGIVTKVELVEETPQTTELRINFLLVASDISATLGDTKQALDRAQEAKRLAETSIATDSNDPTRLRLVYFSAWRIADALLQQSGRNVDEALQAYDGALDLVKRLAARASESESWQREISFMHGKIGDCYQIKRNIPRALSEYRMGVSIMQALVDNSPGRADLRRDLASSFSRLGQALAAQGTLAEALEQYQSSLKIRLELVKDNDNDGYRSNLAFSYAEVGSVLQRLERPDEALAAYQQGLEIRELLASKDPDNAIWQRYLGSLFERVGDLLSKQGKLADALDAYRKGFVIGQILAAKDIDNVSLQQGLATSAAKLGGLLVAQTQLDEALRTYLVELRAIERLVRGRPANVAWQFRRASSLSKIGDVMVAQGHGSDALAQYQQALAILDQLIAGNPVNTEWQQLRESIKDKMQSQASVR